jgi:hypothetical protein
MMNCKRKKSKIDKNWRLRLNYFKIDKYLKNKNKKSKRRKLKIKSYKGFYKIKNCLGKSSNKKCLSREINKKRTFIK